MGIWIYIQWVPSLFGVLLVQLCYINTACRQDSKIRGAIGSGKQSHKWERRLHPLVNMTTWLDAPWIIDSQRPTLNMHKSHFQMDWHIYIYIYLYIYRYIYIYICMYVFFHVYIYVVQSKICKKKINCKICCRNIIAHQWYARECMQHPPWIIWPSFEIVPVENGGQWRSRTCLSPSN